MSSSELFRKHFGEESGYVDLKHPNAEKFFEELNKECLKEDSRIYCVKEHRFFSTKHHIIEKNLTKKEAYELYRRLYEELEKNGGDENVHYMVHTLDDDLM